MKIISNYLEEGIGAGAQKQTKKRTFPFRECKTKMATMAVSGPVDYRPPFCTGARISEKRERGWSTPALEKAKRESEEQNADSSTLFLIVC